MKIRFEDLNTYNTSGYYIAPNEEPLLHRQLVKDLYISRAAAICSAGEVGLLSILPSVRDELVLIDHSYTSLAVGMMKYLWLAQNLDEILKIISNPEKTNIDEISKQLIKYLPAPPQHHFNGQFIPTQKYGSKFSDYYDKTKINSEIVRAWNVFPDSLIRKVASKLNKVSFLHCDLEDIVDRGPFDLFYLSNALGYGGRNGHSVTGDRQKNIANTVKDGGYVLSTTRITHKMFTLVKQLSATWSSWPYLLYQVNK